MGRLLVFMAIFLVLTLVWRVLPGHSWGDALIGGACSLAGLVIGNLVVRLVERRRRPAPGAPALPDGWSPDRTALPATGATVRAAVQRAGSAARTGVTGGTTVPH